MKAQTFYKQSGVTLVFSLVILVALTMLGIASIQTTRTELSMAGNQRESSLMFQAAEMGLNAAENFVDTTSSNGDFDNNGIGLYTVLGNDTSYTGPNYFKDTTWLTASQEAGTGVYSSAKPRYMIEYLGDRKQNPLADIKIGLYGTGAPGDIVSIYRSTSRGVGLTGNSFRYVQSYYGKLKL